jgi:hypothetical protein
MHILNNYKFVFYFTTSVYTTKAAIAAIKTILIANSHIAPSFSWYINPIAAFVLDKKSV